MERESSPTLAEQGACQGSAGLAKLAEMIAQRWTWSALGHEQRAAGDATMVEGAQKAMVFA